MSLRGIDPPSASTDQVVDCIVQIFQVSPSQARNAYSALLLLPGVGGFRFHPLLTPYKRMWNQNVEKYGHFWDPTPVLHTLMLNDMPLLHSNISLLRTQLILCCRLLCLYRSHDLSQLRRTVSVLGQKIPFIKSKRKGQKIHKLERMLSISECPQISPFHLLQAYVDLTKDQGHVGGPVLLTLNAPFRAISADTVGSITKRFLNENGIPSNIWGPHSTRGAGVGFLKKLGLSGDEVCEIGKWKSVESFCSHYQRLGAQEKVEEKIVRALAFEKGVHNLTSHRGSAEPEVSRTPPSQSERGGRDTEGEAQGLCEPTRPTPKRERSPEGWGGPLPLPRRSLGRHRRLVSSQLRQNGGTNGERPNQKTETMSRQERHDLT